MLIYKWLYKGRENGLGNKMIKFFIWKNYMNPKFLKSLCLKNKSRWKNKFVLLTSVCDHLGPFALDLVSFGTFPFWHWVNLATVETPSTNLVLKRTFALLNIPSFRDTTMNLREKEKQHKVLFAVSLKKFTLFILRLRIIWRYFVITLNAWLHAYAHPQMQVTNSYY